MKFYSKAIKIIKTILLLFLLSNMEILVLSSNIKHFSFKNKITKTKNISKSHEINDNNNNKSQIRLH